MWEPVLVNDVVGWKCTGCRQVRWQKEPPTEACDVCGAAPSPDDPTAASPGPTAPADVPASPEPTARRKRSKAAEEAVAE